MQHVDAGVLERQHQKPRLRGLTHAVYALKGYKWWQLALARCIAQTQGGMRAVLYMRKRGHGAPINLACFQSCIHDTR